MIREMTFAEFMKTHYGAEDVLLLDVRDEAPYMHGTVPKAVNLPMSRIRELYTLPKEKRIFVFCQSDIISREITELLSDADYNATNLTGGYRQFLRDISLGEYDLPKQR